MVRALEKKIAAMEGAIEEKNILIEDTQQALE
jgi:hypothetical protein